METAVVTTDGGLKLFGPEMLGKPCPASHRLRATHPVI